MNFSYYKNLKIVGAVVIVALFIFGLGFLIYFKNPSRFPKDINGVDLIVTGIRQSVNPKFKMYTIDQLFNIYSLPRETLERSYIIFFDYENDGKMDFVTSYTGDGLMMYAASSTSIIEKVSVNYLDKEVFNNGGKIYYRELDWDKIANE